MAAKNFHEWWQDNGALEDCSFSVIAALAWNAATKAAEERFTSHIDYAAALRVLEAYRADGHASTDSLNFIESWINNRR